MSSAIGGYLGIEQHLVHSQFYRNPAQFNSGRSALLFYLSQHPHLTHILLPQFFCGEVINTLQHCGYQLDYYALDTQLNISSLPDSYTPQNTLVVLVNYFDIKRENITAFIKSNPLSHVIIDCSQAYFSQWQAPAFYSPRKFFGVLDGGELTPPPNEEQLAPYPQQINQETSHYLHSPYQGTEPYYNDYVKHESEFNHAQIKRCSALSQQLLSIIDYPLIAKKRQQNFTQLHQALRAVNSLNLCSVPNTNATALCYPLLHPKGNKIKQHLLAAKIYVPTYWRDSPNQEVSIVKYLVDNLVCLPIDQRYSEVEMQRIIKTISEVL